MPSSIPRRFAATLALLGGLIGVPAEAEEIMPIRVLVAQPVSTAATERYAATLQARVETSLGFRIDGKIIERLVNIGDRVTPGQALERLDPSDFHLNERVAAAQVTSAKADFTKAQADFSRGETLLKQGWATRATYDQRKQTRDAAVAQLQEAQENLRIAADNLKYTTLNADTAGVITAVSAEPGQVVTSGQEVMRLAHQGEIEAVVDLPEQMVARLSELQFTVTLWAVPGEVIRAHLRELSPSADPGTRTYRARLTLESPPAALQLGMTATVIAEDRTSSKIILLPMTALFHDGPDPAVWVVTPGGDHVALRRVAIAAYLDNQIAVAGGLNTGDTVVTAGAFKLTSQDHVRIWAEPQR